MKKATFIIASIFLFSLQGACKPSNKSNKQAEALAQKEQTPVQTETENGLKKAYFASGCFPNCVGTCCAIHLRIGLQFAPRGANY